jgi:hypothetical protein
MDRFAIALNKKPKSTQNCGQLIRVITVDNSSGMKRFDIEYPDILVSGHGGETQIVIQDGTFEKCRRDTFTGQHTDLYADEAMNDELTPFERPKIFPSTARWISMHGDYIYVSMFSRSRYGGQKKTCRINIIDRCIERAIRRNGNTSWHRFDPAHVVVVPQQGHAPTRYDFALGRVAA